MAGDGVDGDAASFSRAAMARDALKVGLLGLGDTPDLLRRSAASTFLSSTSFLKPVLESVFNRLDPKDPDPFDALPLALNDKLSALGFPVVKDRVKPLLEGELVVVEV